jgi:hypothetical protein
MKLAADRARSGAARSVAKAIQPAANGYWMIPNLAKV